MENEFVCKGPYKIKKVLFTRRYKAGYVYRHEIVDDSDCGGKGMEMTNCYTPDGYWIGSPREARFLCVKRGLSKLQKAHKNHCVCSIGFNEKEKKWYGWSHRAICGFGIGDRVYNERWKHATNKTPFKKHGDIVIEKLAQAKLAAKRFAASVS